MLLLLSLVLAVISYYSYHSYHSILIFDFRACFRGFLVSLSALCRVGNRARPPSGGARICKQACKQVSIRISAEPLYLGHMSSDSLFHLVAYFAATLVRAHGPPLTTTNTNTPVRSMPSASPSLGHYQSSHPSLHPSSLPPSLSSI